MWKILWILSLLIAMLWGTSSRLSPPATMMILSIWIFLTAKVQSFEFKANHPNVTASGLPAWCFLTPTLDHRRFLQTHESTLQNPSGSGWWITCAHLICGVILFCFVAPRLLILYPVVAGWVAMIGIALWLHFGILGLIVLSWRSRGRDIQPLMQTPLLSTSLSEFWGRRWNTAFRDFTHQQIFRPVCRHWNAQSAMFASFVFSGVIHDLAISIPARGGYGLPTLYFLLQYAGIFLEKTAALRRWGLGSGWRGWLYTATFVLGPAGLLFHNDFVLRVIVPLTPSHAF